MEDVVGGSYDGMLGVAEDEHSVGNQAFDVNIYCRPTMFRS